MKKVGKLIGFIGICLFAIGLSYVVTKHLDKNLYLNTNILVTFEDTEEFNLENTNVLTKEKAIEEYPNTFKVKNNSLKKVKYQVKLVEKDSNIDNSKLKYVLYLNGKEVKSGKVSDLDILYEQKIDRKKEDVYKLYLYFVEEFENPVYTYSIEVDASR